MMQDVAWVLYAWDGPVPANHADALRIFAELDVTASEEEPPTDAICGYVEEMLQRYPEIGDDAGIDSPWSDGPLIGNARGPLFVFGLVYNSLEDSIPFCTDVARKRGIVLYDPEQEEVYAPVGIPAAPIPAPDVKPKRRLFRRR